MIENKKKRGPQPLGEKAFTAAEKMQRLRARKALQIKAAKSCGHTPMTIMVDDQHMEAFEELYQRWGGSRTGEFNLVIFSALKSYFEDANTNRAKENDWNEVSGSQLIEMEASKLFIQWEKQQ